MRWALAIALLAAPAAPVLAQQPAAPDLGRNYNELPFVYDLVARLKPYPTHILDPKDHARARTCQAQMMRELRRSGLAENGKDAYRRCAERLGILQVGPGAPGVRPAQ
jgi:hypothetical protein